MSFRKNIKQVLLLSFCAVLVIGIFTGAFFMDNKLSGSEGNFITDEKSDKPEESTILEEPTIEEFSCLKNKKIIYDGDSICMGLYGGGGYAQQIADSTESDMENFSIGGGD